MTFLLNLPLSNLFHCHRLVLLYSKTPKHVIFLTLSTFCHFYTHYNTIIKFYFFHFNVKYLFLATLLVEGISHCKTIRIVSVEDCHLTACANVLLPAISKMLLLTAASGHSLHTLRLPGLKFPALKNLRGNSPKKKRRNNKSSTSSSIVKTFCDAIVTATDDPSSSFTALDISRSTIGNSASIVLSKAIQHLSIVHIENIHISALVSTKRRERASRIWKAL